MPDNTTFSFLDLIKKSALEQFSGALSPSYVLITLALALAAGLFIAFVYRKAFVGVLFSHTYMLSLIMLTVVTAVIVIPITSNLALSLGMVGALSIVRFRTAVKDAMDTIYMFWCVAMGICLGAGFWFVGVVSALFVGTIMIVVTSIKIKQSMPYLLVIHHHSSASSEVKKLLSSASDLKLKSKVLRGDAVELTYEIRLTQNQDSLVEKFLDIDGVYDASLLTYQGDVIS